MTIKLSCEHSYEQSPEEAWVGHTWCIHGEPERSGERVFAQQLRTRRAFTAAEHLPSQQSAFRILIQTPISCFDMF